MRLINKSPPGNIFLPTVLIIIQNLALTRNGERFKGFAFPRHRIAIPCISHLEKVVTDPEQWKSTAVCAKTAFPFWPFIFTLQVMKNRRHLHFPPQERFSQIVDELTLINAYAALKRNDESKWCASTINRFAQRKHRRPA